jgi:glycosyltransferase involved in cell wall biosynthesis
LTIENDKENYLLLLFGNIKNDSTFLSDLPVPVRYVGLLSDMRDLVKLYQAADVTVMPSLYETFGQTISEAMACGCPAVSFDNSGQTDIIDHKINGYLAAYQSVDDLAKGIHWVLSDADYASLSAKATEKVRCYYAEWIVAGQYIDLYTSISHI